MAAYCSKHDGGLGSRDNFCLLCFYAEEAKWRKRQNRMKKRAKKKGRTK